MRSCAKRTAKVLLLTVAFAAPGASVAGAALAHVGSADDAHGTYNAYNAHGDAYDAYDAHGSADDAHGTHGMGSTFTVLRPVQPYCGCMAKPVFRHHMLRWELPASLSVPAMASASADPTGASGPALATAQPAPPGHSRPAVFAKARVADARVARKRDRKLTGQFGGGTMPHIRPGQVYSGPGRPKQAAPSLAGAGLGTPPENSLAASTANSSGMSTTSFAALALGALAAGASALKLASRKTRLASRKTRKAKVTA